MCSLDRMYTIIITESVASMDLRYVRRKHDSPFYLAVVHPSRQISRLPFKQRTCSLPRKETFYHSSSCSAAWMGYRCFNHSLVTRKTTMIFPTHIFPVWIPDRGRIQLGSRMKSLLETQSDCIHSAENIMCLPCLSSKRLGQ